MKNFMLKKVCSVLVFIFMLAGIVMVAPVVTNAAGTTYYLDSVGGNDSNAGTSTSAAWKSLSKVGTQEFAAGDKLLLKAGCSWTGTLHPLGSGASGNPVVIDMYGTGNKPIINGNGAANAVYLSGQSYWEINNLEITNNASSEGDRRGVFIEAKNGTTNHVYVLNCYIHNVRGNNDFSTGKTTGGIILYGDGGASTKYNDILLQGNTINYCDRSGILAVESCGAMSTGVVLRNNVINYPGGDGAILITCASPLAEYNVVNTSDNVSTEVSAGIWPYACTNAVFQYNEGYNCKMSADYDDGMPWDVDGSNTGCIYQYNYSHDNYGGCMMICADASCPSYDSVFRYNISQNDGRIIFNLTGPSQRTNIYNNTVYLSSSMSTDIVGAVNLGGWHKYAYFYNNIIYNLGAGGYNFGKTANNTFDYNVFYGNHPSGEPSDAHKLTSNPMLVNPGSGSTGRNTVDGYKLQAGSPCIDSGKAISGNGGKDYWGTAVPQGSAADRGACEYTGTVTIPPVPSGLAASPVSSSQINVTWNTAAGATGYDLLVDGATVTGATSPYAHTGLAAGSAHTYQVRSKNSAGTSSWSSAVSATTQTASSNLALNKPAMCSTIEGSGFEAGKAVDGSTATRWASAEGVNATEWITVDLGSVESISKVVMKWEAAYAKAYTIQVSTDGTNFTNALSVTNATGGTDTRTFTAKSARYVKIYCTQKYNTSWGYSLYELEVYRS